MGAEGTDKSPLDDHCHSREDFYFSILDCLLSALLRCNSHNVVFTLSQTKIHVAITRVRLAAPTKDVGLSHVLPWVNSAMCSPRGAAGAGLGTLCCVPNQLRVPRFQKGHQWPETSLASFRDWQTTPAAGRSPVVVNKVWLEGSHPRWKHILPGCFCNTAMGGKCQSGCVTLTAKIVN